MVKHVTLHLTQKCNLNCKFCHTNAGGILKKDRLIDTVVIENLFHNSFYSLSLAGGEPFAARERLYHFISNIPKNINNIAITTNGTLITDDDFEYIKGKKIRLQFSVDGTKDTHDNIRGEDNYNRSLQNIRKAIEYGIRVDILTTVSKTNINNIKYFLKRMDKLKIKNINLLHFTPKGRGRYYPEEEVDIHEWMDFVHKMKTTYKTEKVRVWIQPRFLKKEQIEKLENERKINICNHLKYDFAYIDLTTGNVYPCGLAYDTDINIGTLYEKTLKQLVDNHLNKVEQLQIECSECDMFSKCRGGARCYSYFYYGNINNKDPKCLLEKNIIPICPFPAAYVCGPKVNTERPTIV